MTFDSVMFERARPWIGLVARLLLGVVWIWASLSKISNPRTFVQTVRAYDATPEWLSKAIGYGLPVLELCIGVVLIVGIVVRIAAVVSGLLFLVFLIGLIQAAARGISLTCGCFGGGGTTDGSTSYTLDILRDTGLLIVAAYLVVWSFSRFSIEEFLGRHDAVPMPSAKRMRTPEGRKRYEAQLAVARAHARSRDSYVSGLVGLVIVLVSVIGIGVQAGRAKVSDVVAGTHSSVTHGVVFGKAAAATLDVYEDFGCPICEEFEQATHTKLEADVRANLVQVRYHTIQILDRSSPNQYSTRAANAALCVSDVSVEAFIAYHDILYGSSGGKQVQPTEGTAGPGNTELVTLAKQLTGAAKLTTAQITTMSDCVTELTYKPLVEELTEKASQAGVTGTPTLVLNGKTLNGHDATTLFAAIAAADKGHTPVPSVTPKPSATPSKSTSTAVSSSASVSPSTSGSTSPAPAVSKTPSVAPSTTPAASPSTSAASPST